MQKASWILSLLGLDCRRYKGPLHHEDLNMSKKSNYTVEVRRTPSWLEIQAAMRSQEHHNALDRKETKHSEDTDQHLAASRLWLFGTSSRLFWMILGFYGGYIGIMENKMETTIV